MTQLAMDEFEGALFTVHQTDKRARVPIISDKTVFDRVASLGRRLAELEKAGYSPENHLGFDYEASVQLVPDGFRLANSSNPFDEENEELILTDGNTNIRIHCPVALQQLNISGYDVIKSVWLKFHSYAFTHCDFVRDDMKQLLDFLNTLEEHTRIVALIDEVVRDILHGTARLVLPE